jgi:UDP-N-acetylglucosamine transferase subunit ALG13
MPHSVVPPGRHLLIASPGGHVVELKKWSQRLGSAPDSLWVTHQSAQTEVLLAGARVLDVPYVAPRDIKAGLKVLIRILHDVDWKKEHFVGAITTGAALGAAGLVAARLHRIPAVFIESLARMNGPSLSARIVALDPGIKTYCQWPQWANRRWEFGGSVLEQYESVPATPVSGCVELTSNPRIFVTLGTIQPHRFDSVIDAVLASGLADENTVWQLGATVRADLPGTVKTLMSDSEFAQYAGSADVVVTHAGAGTIMTLFDLGIFPVVIPRRRRRQEHVDDHQVELAGFLASKGLATVCDAEHLDESHLNAAAVRTIRPLH